MDPPGVRHKGAAVLCQLGKAKPPGHQELFRRNRQWQVLGIATADLTVLLSCWNKRILDTFEMPQTLSVWKRARGSGCIWCQYIYVLVSDSPFCGLLSTENVYSNLLSEINLFSNFLMEKSKNPLVQNALCSTLC